MSSIGERGYRYLHPGAGHACGVITLVVLLLAGDVIFDGSGFTIDGSNFEMSIMAFMFITHQQRLQM